MSFPGPATAQADQPWQGFVHGQLGAASNPTAVGAMAIGGVGAFLPLAQNADSLLYLDGRYHADGEADTTSLGIGLRSRQWGDWILGGNLFIDHHRSAYGDQFGRVSIGVEAMSADWDVRVNGYAPLGPEHQVEALSRVVTVNGFPALDLGFQQSLWGADAELGYRVYASDDDAMEARLFIGGYAFGADGYDTRTGVTARAEMRLFDLPGLANGSRLHLSAEGRYDGDIGADFAGFVRLRLPFQHAPDPVTPPYDATDRRMLDLVRRDTDGIGGMTLGTRREAPPDDYVPTPGGPFTVYFETGKMVESILYTSEGGNGTMDGSTPANAADYSAATIAGAGENALIAVLDQNGTITIEDGIAMLAGQAIFGGGSTLMLADDQDNPVPFTAPGGRPLIVANQPNDNSFDHITIADCAIVQGLELFHGRSSIVGAGIDGAILRDLRLIDPQGDGGNSGSGIGSPIARGDGIFIDGGQNITIADIYYEERIAGFTEGDGIDLRGIDGVTIDDVTLISADRTGLRLTDTTNFTVTGADIRDTRLIGLFVFEMTDPGTSNTLSDISIADPIDENRNQGAYILRAQNVTMTDFTITGSGQEGIDLVDSQQIGLSFGSVSSVYELSGDSDAAIHIEGSSGVSISSVGISQAGGGALYGLAFRDGVSIRLADSAIADIATGLRNTNGSTVFAPGSTGNTTTAVGTLCSVAGGSVNDASLEIDALAGGAVCP